MTSAGREGTFTTLGRKDSKGVGWKLETLSCFFVDEEFSSFKNGILVHILHIGKLMDEETGSVTS